MRCTLGLVLGFLTMGAAMLGGCNNGSGSGPLSQGQGLLSGAGIGDASSVRAVIVGISPVVKITDAATIRGLYDAVEHPDRDFVSKMARNRQMAFVGRHGQVAYLVYSDGGDLTARQGSSKLVGLVRQAFNNPANRDSTHVPVGTIAEVRLQSPQGTAVVSTKPAARWDKVGKSLTVLLGMWNPNDLRGCKYSNRQEMDALSARAARYVDVALARPTTFETLIVPSNFAWWPPPKTVETRAKFETVQCSALRLINDGAGTMRLAFESGRGGQWLLTPQASTKQFLGYGPQGQSRFGSDLFDELVSALLKP